MRAPERAPSGSARQPSSAAPGGAAGATARPEGERDRNGRPITGTAIPRDITRGPIRGGSPNASVNSWYPWYGSGLNWYYGYSPYYGASLYGPFMYGSSRWAWGRYGIWYDPFDPFAYSSLYADPFYGAGGYAGGYSSSYGGSFYGGSSSSYTTVEPEPTGSVRLRVKPGNGKVYLDGTYIGIVDQFDGLSSHLAAPAGPHEIEVRADGYQTLKLLVEVQGDRTITARGSLKKQ